MKNKVCFFEIPTSDVNKAKAFYEIVFDWKVKLEGDDGAHHSCG
jgi:predicted enzyme related to lactoylglutathione lyase